MEELCFTLVSGKTLFFNFVECLSFDFDFEKREFFYTIIHDNGIVSKLSSKDVISYWFIPC